VKLGAIDIGSNAIRLQVTNVLETPDGPFFKKLEYVRFPMRLGKDVFDTGKISEGQKEKFLQLMHAFKILIDLYELTDYMGCATSAMREAENGAQIIKLVKDTYDLNIDIIDGEEEAQMINNAILSYLDERTYLHIDVGGGSTELNVYKEGRKIQSASFKIGSVRRLSMTDAPATWKEMEDWVRSNFLLRKERPIAVGTGGNINKFFELAKLKSGRIMSLNRLLAIQKLIREMPFEQRLLELQLNPDRADVIIPASEIYVSVMKWAGSHSILVPSVGLKDGMMKMLYERNTQ